MTVWFQSSPMKNQLDGSHGSTASSCHSPQLGALGTHLGHPELLLAPRVGKPTAKIPTFTYHTVQAPLLDFAPAASTPCVLRPAGKEQDQVGHFPPDIPAPPLDCEFWLCHMELQGFCCEEKPFSLHSKAKRTESCQMSHFEGGTSQRLKQKLLFDWLILHHQ